MSLYNMPKSVRKIVQMGLFSLFSLTLTLIWYNSFTSQFFEQPLFVDGRFHFKCLFRTNRRCKIPCEKKTTIKYSYNITFLVSALSILYQIFLRQFPLLVVTDCSLRSCLKLLGIMIVSIQVCTKYIHYRSKVYLTAYNL